MRWLKSLFFLFLIVYFLAVVIARVPAAWAAWVALKAVPELSLAGVSGTAWEGRAVGAQVQLGPQRLDLGGLRWDVAVLPLLALSACADVQSEMFTGNVCHSLAGGNKVQGASIDGIPASLLDARLGVSLGGVAGGVVQRARFTDDGQLTELAGTFTWQGARVNYGDGWMPLGSFAAELQDDGQGGVSANIFDTEGAIGVNFQGLLAPTGEVRGEGFITPRDGAPQQLINGLSVMAEAQDDGSYRVTWPMGG